MKFKKTITSLLVATFGLLQFAPVGFANPDLDQITYGSGSVTINGTTYNFQQDTDRLVALFNSFNIDGSERVNVLQPSSSSAALFRIQSQDPSQILGGLSANGMLMLINPNGIMFGPGSQVNVGSLVASSLDIRDSDFLAGTYALSGSGALGQVINQGSMTAQDGGYLALLGGSVANEGSMRANGGSVLLGAGNAATLSVDGRGMMNIAIDQATVAGLTDVNGQPVRDAARNSGLLQADGGLVKVSAKAVEGAFDNVINHSGVAEARSASVRNGVIVFDGGNTGITRISGIADATGLGAGQTGGRIEVTGKYVGVTNGAVLDASGANGGGAVLVGGDYQGTGSLANAKETIIASGAVLKADAVTNGNGGKIVVWSDEATKYYGNLSARGGSEGGNGGFAEVSGKENLLFRGGADLGASNGNTGTLLLDPLNITIVNGAAPPPRQDAEIGDSQILFGDSGGPASWDLNEQTVEALTANVIFQAQQDFIISNLTDNNLNMANLTGGESIVIQAGRHITFNDTNDAITTNGAAIHLEADSPHSTAGAADGTGTMTLGKLTSNGGDITLIGSDFVLSTAIDSGAGNVAIANSVNGTALGLGTAAGAQLTDTELDLISSTGTITLGQATTKGTNGAGAGASTLTAGNITVDGLTQGSKNLSLKSSGTINDADDTGSAIVTTGTVTLASGGQIGNLNGAQGLNLDASGITITSTGGNNALITSAGTSATAFSAATGGAGDVTIVQSANNLNVGAVSTTGNANLTATTGAITDGNGATTNVTATSLSASAVTGVDLDTTVTNLTATNSGAGNITLSESDSANLLNVSAVNGDVIVGSGTGSLNVGTVSASGTARLQAFSGQITDANGAVNNITATNLLALAGTGVDLDSNVTNITSTNSGAGNINIDEANGANILNVAASNGNATVTSATGDLNISSMTATNGTATVTATTGAITDANGATNNITATSLVAAAATGVDLDTTVTNLTATNSGAGNIILDESNGANVLNVAASNGNTTITSATGDLNITSVAAVGGTATLTATTGAITDANLGVNSVTANNLIATAASGIGTNANRLETTVSKLEASGGLGGVFVKNTGALTIGGITAMNGVSATGSDIKITTASPMTVDETVSNTGGGNIVLGANGNVATDDMTINANVTATGGNGSITIGAGDSIALANGTTVSTKGTGAVNIVAGENLADSETVFNQDGNIGAAGGSITMGATSNVTTEDGNILLDAASSVTAGNVNADSDNDNIQGTITVAARAGAILDGNGNNVNFTGDAIGLTAGGGIGTNADRIETTVNRLEANGGTGGVFVQNSKALEIGNVSASLTGVTASGSDVKVFALGPMTVSEAVTNTGGGNIELAAKGSSAAEDITLNANVAATGGNGSVTLAAGDTIFVNNGRTVSAVGTGNVTLVAGENYTDETLNRDGDADGEIQMGATGAVTTADGNILLDARNNVVLSTVNANSNADATLGTVTINAVAGKITDANGAAMNVTGASLLTRAGQGVGTAADLIESTVSNFEAEGGTGGVHLINTGALVIGGVDAGVTGVSATGNTIEVYAQSPLTVNEAVTNTGGGNITLASLGAAATDDLTLNANVAATGGNGSVLLVSGDTTILNAGVTVSAVGTGAVTVAAGEDYTDLTLDQDGNIGAAGGSITMNSTSSILSEDGNINLDAANAAAISVLNAESDLDSSLGNVMVRARAGAITDANAATLNITADKLLLNGQTGVAALADTLETNVNILEAAGNAGGVFVADENDLTIGGFTSTTGVSAAGGEILVSAKGALTVNEAVANTGANNVRLFALGNDATRDLTLNANVSSLGGNLTLTSGDTTQISNGVTVSTNGAGTVEIFAGEDATDLVQNQDGNAGGSIIMGSNAAVQTADGNATLDARDAIQVASINANTNADATKGNVFLTARGSSITDANANTLNITAGGLVMSAVSGIASNSDRLETQVDNLEASAGSGGLFVTNTGAMTIGGVSGMNGASATGSDVRILTSGALTVSEDVANSGGGSIFLNANGVTAASDLTFNSGADITATGGNGSILLTAGDTIAMGAGSIASVQGAGTVTLAAGEDFADEVLDQDGSATGDITMSAGSGIQTPVGNILIDAARNIQAAQANANNDANATIGDVAMIARAGAVTDADGATLNITADDLTIQAASGVAVDGDRLETQVAKFESNAGTGGLFVANTGNLEIGSASSGFSGITATGSDVKVTATGSMNITENVANSGGGNILLASNGAAATNDVTVNANITATGGNGNILVSAGDTLDLEAGRTISAAGTGAVSLLGGENLTDSEVVFNQDGSATGDVNLKVNNILLTESIVKSDDGNILVDAARNVLVTTVNADANGDNTRGNVTMRARSGSITDNNDGIAANKLNITANGLQMEAATGIAANANRMETKVNSLEAAGGTGGMFIENQGALTVGGVTGTLAGLSATGSNIKVFSTGAVTVNEAIANSGGGNIEVAAKGATAAEDLTINANIAATGGNGNIILAAGDTISQLGTTEISAAGTGAVTMAAGENYTDETLNQDGSATGDILQASGAIVSSQDGNLLLDAARHVNLSVANANRNADATLGNVRVLARSGAITDSNAGTLNVLANTLELQSAQGVAVDADRLETTVNNIEATGGTGGVFIQESDALTIGGVTASLGGITASGNAIKITSEGDMTISEGVSQTTSGSDILLAARGAGANVNVNAAVAASGGNGNITVAANESVAMNASGSISAAGTGTVNVLAGENLTDSETVFNRDGSATGDVTMNTASSINSQNGNIRVDARDSLSLSTVNANSNADATTGNVALRARTGSITDTNGATLNITAQDLLIQAGTSIAANADRLETSAANLAAAADAGGLFVSNTGALTVTQLTEIAMADGRVITGLSSTAGGDLITTATGAMTVNQAVSAAGGGQVLLASNGTAATNDLTLNANVSATGGNGKITLAAGDTLTFAPGVSASAAGTGAVNALAGESLTDSETIFNQDGNASGDLTMGLGSSITSQDGSILVDARDNAAIDTINANSNADATAGDVTVRARAGAITDVNAATMNITGRNLSMTAATGIASAADELETTVNRMEVSNGTGGIFTNNTGALEIGNADAALTGIQNAGGDVRIIGNSSITVNEAMANTGGGNTTITGNGAVAGDSIIINANIANTGGNGNMTLSAGDEILVNGASVVSAAGTGAIAATSGTGVAGADITMAPGSAFRAKDGNITLTADGDANIAEVNANSDGDLTRGNVTINANGNGGANGDILDTNDAPLVTNNITAATFIATAAGDIGALANPLEVNAATVGPLTTGGSANLNLTSGGNTLFQDARITGALNLMGTGNLFIENNVVGQGATLDMTGSILTGGKPSDDLTAQNIVLFARGGTLGTPDQQLNLISRGESISIFAGGEINGESVNIHSNITRDGLLFMNVPPGLVLVNNGIAGGGNMPSLNKSSSGEYAFFLNESPNFGSIGQVRNQETAVHPFLMQNQADHARPFSGLIKETDVVADLAVVPAPTEVRTQTPITTPVLVTDEEQARKKAAAEAARLQAAREEAARMEAVRVEAARLEAARIEAVRIEAARIEAARLAAVRLEAQRLEAARLAALRTQTPAPVQTPQVQPTTQPQGGLTNIPFRNLFQGLRGPGLGQVQVEEAAAPGASGSDQTTAKDGNSSGN